MGLYIDPKDMGKEDWLAKHGHAISEAPKIARSAGCTAVCVADNGIFTAAGVCFDDRELAAFARSDGRPKFWFMVPDEKIEDVTGVNIDQFNIDMQEVM